MRLPASDTEFFILVPLLENRVETAEPFEVIGIDFAGPIYLRKVAGLSTGKCLQNLRRFVVRHERLAIIYTDNETNFTGAIVF